MPDDHRYCGYCGVRLDTLPGADLASEQREATVMFVDVTNFTAASHTMDSEQVFAWMDETMRLLAAVVDRYEGTIDKFTGDGLMALFGVPTTHEDDPERAVRAALEMQQALAPLRARLAKERGATFQVRIGLNSGPLVAGMIGGERHGEYTVLGDSVNLAARLEKAAEPGTVLVSASTYARTAPLFSFQPMPPLYVKGVSEPLQTYRPLGPAAQPGSLRGIAGLRAPLIGRAADLDRLQSHIGAICDDHRRRAALISGDAGVGKSRLVAELRRRLDDLPIRCIQATCRSHTRNTPLWLAGELLRDLIGVGPADPPDVRDERQSAFLQRQGLSPADILPYLRHAMGEVELHSETTRLADLEPSMLQLQTQTAFRLALLAEARTAPLVLICDDLHWADDPSRELLRYVLETTHEAPLCLVMILRASEIALAHSLIADVESQICEVHLNALSETEGLAMIGELLQRPPGSDTGLALQIVERATGNPFYIEELIRMLIEQGGLTLGAGGWEIAPHVGDLLGSVPPSLRDLILARFDRLPIDLRLTLQRMAAIGRAAPLRLLARLDGGAVQLTGERLRDLEDRSFVTRVVRAEPGYALQNALVQDAVYETMLRRDRRQMHTLIAEAVVAESCWEPDERSDVLAHQYAESATPQLAISYQIESAERGERRFASATAAQLYRQAITLIEQYPAGHGEQAVRARIGLGRSLKYLGGFAEASTALEEARERLLVGGLPPDMWRASSVAVLGELADVRTREGQLDTAADTIQSGLMLLGPADRSPAWRLLTYRLASVYLRQGQIDAALALAESAVHETGPETDQIILASLYRILAGVYYERDRLGEAVSYVERSLAIYQEIGYAPGTAAAYDNLGSLYYAQGRWGQAVESLAQALHLRRQIGYMPDQALTLANLGHTRMALGDHDRAAQDFVESRAISERLGEELGVVRADLGLGHLALLHNHLGEARRYLDNAATHMDAVGEDETIQFHLLCALLIARSGDVPGGRALAEEGLAAARAASLAELESEALRSLGEICALQGASDQAGALLRESIARCRQRGDHYQLALSLLSLGTLDPQVEDSRAILTEAAQEFARLGASYDLGRARAALGEYV
ncbi:tetratricopeptide repeat protein [Oscillochloris sp. ZM17-4]|uniref:ATP-binding protein n=1 Tax=Oscillochloris sp. ZM17-4 TaxID=2866714 RepID=UPI001C732D3B|nr:tetratricopeptide repeat protein [Oscillochloris sp. ZM17-4]